MSNLWPEPSSPTVETPAPAVDTPTREGNTADIAAQHMEAPAVSPVMRDLLQGGFQQTYGGSWPEAYGTAVGRSLTGASLEEALPPAPGQTDVRAQLAGALGAQHPETDAAMRGALTETMTPEMRAVVNGAALDAAVAHNPEVLLDIPPDIPRDHLVAWRALAGKTLPAAVTDRMGEMNAPIREAYRSAYEIRMQHRQPNEVVTSPNPTLWAPLDVRNASGGIVNMDYFAVRVQMPRGADPAVFLNQIRENMDRFVDTDKSSFQPYPAQAGNRDNVARWNSTNPTGSFVTIDIPFNDGTVAVIDSGPDHWTFATVQSPGDGLHPVSGNREFGYTDNGDGTFTFYTRGVDRITDNGTRAINALTGAAFEGADALWESFQARIADYVRQTGGRAQIETPVIVRPDWSDVRNVLTGRESVDAYLQRANP